MISLKRSLDDYERTTCLASGLSDTVRATFESLRQYVVETEPPLVEQFRSWSDSLLRSLDACLREPAERSFIELRTSIRAGLRDYRDRAGRYIADLRARLDSTTTAMHEMLATLQAGDSDGEAQLKGEIGRLTSLETATSLDEFRSGLHHSVASLTACMTQLRQEKNVIITQLRDEIRTLQHSLDEARQGATVDSITGAYNRGEFERLLTKALNTERSCAVIRIALQNLRDLEKWYPRDIINQLLDAVFRRARGVFGEPVTLGQWQEDVLCILLRSADTAAVVSELLRQCGGNYVCMEGPHARTLCLQVNVSSFVCTPGSDAERTIEMLDKLSTAITSLPARPAVKRVTPPPAA